MRIPVEKIKEFYEFLKFKNIPDEYIWIQLKRKFNLPRFTLIWALEKNE